MLTLRITTTHNLTLVNTKTKKPNKTKNNPTSTYLAIKNAVFSTTMLFLCLTRYIHDRYSFLIGQ